MLSLLSISSGLRHFHCWKVDKNSSSTFGAVCKKEPWPIHLYFHLRTWYGHMEGAQDLTGQAWLLCLTTQPKCCTWNCAQHTQVLDRQWHSMPRGCYCVTKNAKQTRNFSKWFFSLLEASAPLIDLYVVWSATTHRWLHYQMFCLTVCISFDSFFFLG